MNWDTVIRKKFDLSVCFKQGGFPPDAFYLNKVFDGRKIIVYGAGECCHWFVEIIMKMHGYIPVAFLDRMFKERDMYEGVPAFSPLDYHPTQEEKEEGIVVICVGKEEYYDEIIASLKALGFKNIIFLLEVYEVHNPFHMPCELENKGFDFYRQQEARILETLELFRDEESREVYLRCLQTHMQRKPVPLPKRPRNEQYFPKDIPLRKGYSRFICCGSYDGDTVRLLKERKGKVDEIVCFEPEPKIFKRLSDFLWKHKDSLAQNIVAIPCAVYNEDSFMKFVSNSGLGSRISKDGDSLVQCVTLDRVLPGFHPTFMCMDVEGVEPEVLRGGEGLIRTNLPDLAICVYHAPHHLWEIPLYLHNLNLGYRFYLRNYTSFVSETVLYATT